MKTQQLTYFIYARKSSESEDRQVQSIDDQVKVLQRIASDRSLTVKAVFTEAKSAKEPGRPVFNHMLSEISKGNAHGIICWKLDRLTRNPIDGGTISWMLQKGVIKNIVTSDRSYSPADNVLLMSVEQGMATQYILDLSKNTKRGLLQKVERGWYPAHPALGYLHNPLKKKGEKEVIKDPNAFHLVRKMFDLMLTGNYTPQKILKIATEEWGLRNRYNQKVTHNTIYVVFTNPFYYGVFEYPKGSGNFYKGAHEPMITIDEFDRVQKIMGKAGRPRPKEHTFAYTGLIRCGECGASITAENKTKYQKNGNVHKYIYYHCTKRVYPDCTQKTLEEAELNRQIEQYLEKIYIPEEFLNWAIEELKSEDNKELEKLHAIEASQRRELSIVDTKLDNLLELRLRGDITDEDYITKKAELNKKREVLNFHLGRHASRLEESKAAVIDLLSFASLAKERFIKGSLEDKREILSVLGSNLSIFNRNLRIQFEKPISIVEKISSSLNGNTTENIRLEPAQTPIKKGVYGTFTTLNPLSLRE